MPGYMLHHNPMGHPVMGEIGPRRTAVFKGQGSKLYFYDASFPLGKTCAPPNIRLATCLSYENGCSPRPNRTPKGVRSLILQSVLTRHESEGGQASPHSHTWLPYITPNGVRLAREILINIPSNNQT